MSPADDIEIRVEAILKLVGQTFFKSASPPRIIRLADAQIGRPQRRL
jgi:hypothetical protein